MKYKYNIRTIRWKKTKIKEEYNFLIKWLFLLLFYDFGIHVKLKTLAQICVFHIRNFSAYWNFDSIEMRHKNWIGLIISQVTTFCVPS